MNDSWLPSGPEPATEVSDPSLEFCTDASPVTSSFFSGSQALQVTLFRTLVELSLGMNARSTASGFDTSTLSSQISLLWRSGCLQKTVVSTHQTWQPMRAARVRRNSMSV